jgi:hypothetical protein
MAILSKILEPEFPPFESMWQLNNHCIKCHFTIILKYCLEF